MYNRALSSSEVQQLYRGNPESTTPPMRKTTGFCSRICEGLVVYLPFTLGLTDINADTFGNVIDSNVVSVIDEFNTSPTQAADRDQVANAAYAFDNDSLTLQNMGSVLDDDASFTVALTARLEDTSSFPNEHSGGYYASDTLLRSDNYETSIQYHRYDEEDGGNNLWFTAGNQGAGSESAYSGESDPLVYNHIVGVADTNAQTLSLYVNGELLDVKVWDGEVNIGTDWYLGNGSNGGNSPFKGTLDEVRIYNRALSAEEVRQLHGP